MTLNFQDYKHHGYICVCVFYNENGQDIKFLAAMQQERRGMETKGRGFRKLNDEDLQQVSGGDGGTLMGKQYAPKITCSMCLLNSPLGKPRLVEMKYDGIYHVYGTGECGYCYECPECGFYYHYPVKD